MQVPEVLEVRSGSAWSCLFLRRRAKYPMFELAYGIAPRNRVVLGPHSESLRGVFRRLHLDISLFGHHPIAAMYVVIVAQMNCFTLTTLGSVKHYSGCSMPRCLQQARNHRLFSHSSARVRVLFSFSYHGLVPENRGLQGWHIVSSRLRTAYCECNIADTPLFRL